VPDKLNLKLLKIMDIRGFSQIDRMLDVFRQRAAMQAIRFPGDFTRQTEAQPHQIFELRRTGGRYFFAPIVRRPQFGVPVPDGTFIFAILADNPGRVCCALSDEHNEPSALTIDGHASITKSFDSHDTRKPAPTPRLPAPILYAGILALKYGKLTAWSNGSGHYKPPARLAYQNLIPAVKLLLPIESFYDVKFFG
jgi:insecticidal toxin complex protein TccC